MFCTVYWPNRGWADLINKNMTAFLKLECSSYSVNPFFRHLDGSSRLLISTEAASQGAVIDCIPIRKTGRILATLPTEWLQWNQGTVARVILWVEHITSPGVVEFIQLLAAFCFILSFEVRGVERFLLGSHAVADEGDKRIAHHGLRRRREQHRHTCAILMVEIGLFHNIVILDVHYRGSHWNRPWCSPLVNSDGRDAPLRQPFSDMDTGI